MKIYTRGFLVAFRAALALILGMGELNNYEREQAARPSTPGAKGRVQKDTSAGSVRQTPLLSPPQLAAYLGVPLATIYRWRSRHEGPCGIRVVRHVRYRAEDVEHWLNQCREQRS